MQNKEKEKRDKKREIVKKREGEGKEKGNKSRKWGR